MAVAATFLPASTAVSFTLAASSFATSVVDEGVEVSGTAYVAGAAYGSVAGAAYGSAGWAYGSTGAAYASDGWAYGSTGSVDTVSVVDSAV